MLAVLILACAEADDDGSRCPDLPESPTAVPNVLDNSHDCGYWSVVVDEELVLDMRITEVETPCEMVTGEGLTLLYPPIYTNMSNDEPKWTFQVGAESVATGTTVDVTCDEGSAWSSLVDVVAAD